MDQIIFIKCITPEKAHFFNHIKWKHVEGTHYKHLSEVPHFHRGKNVDTPSYLEQWTQEHVYIHLDGGTQASIYAFSQPVTLDHTNPIIITKKKVTYNKEVFFAPVSLIDTK